MPDSVVARLKRLPSAIVAWSVTGRSRAVGTALPARHAWHGATLARLGPLLHLAGS